MFTYDFFMSLAKDITGERFGKLVAIQIMGKSGREMMWLCLCDCGKEARIRLSNLRTGNTKSCGSCMNVT